MMNFLGAGGGGGGVGGVKSAAGAGAAGGLLSVIWSGGEAGELVAGFAYGPRDLRAILAADGLFDSGGGVA